MKAYILTGNKPPFELTAAELPVPVIQPTELLVQTKAIDINPVDAKTIQGAGQYANMGTDDPKIPGWGLSGIVVKTGSEVTGFQEGDEVFGLVNFPGHGKTYAEYVAVPASEVAKKPTVISHEIAAATTLSALMAWQAIQQAAIKPGERVLIQGVAGGVGFPAFQLAKAAGAYVIGTAAPKDIPQLMSAGLDEAIDFTTTDFEKAVNNIDFVLDTLGGESTIKAMNILSSTGRLITIPSGKGDEWKKVAAEKNINAFFLFVHSSGSDMKALAEALQQGSLRPNIARINTFAEIPSLLRQMMEGKLFGKSVVRIDP